MSSHDSRKPRKEMEKKIQKETPRLPSEKVLFTIDNRYLDVLEDGVKTIVNDLIKIASKQKDCIVTITKLTEGRSRLAVEMEISAVCKTAFTGALYDYKNELKVALKQKESEPSIASIAVFA